MTQSFYRKVFGNYDRISDESRNELEKPFAEKSAMERLVITFTPNEFGELSNEVRIISEVGCMSLFIGAMYGGAVQGKKAYTDFFDNNQATAFKSHLEAKKLLQDKVTLAFGRGAFRFGWRLALFSTMYVSFTTAVSVCRNKNGIVEHVIAGGVAGALYKCYDGPRAMLVGGGLGNALGLFAGIATVSLLKLTGMELSDVYNQSRRFHEDRNEKWRAGLKDYFESEELQIVMENTLKDREREKQNEDVAKNS